jgi:two-component system NtrC family sensor kinase
MPHIGLRFRLVIPLALALIAFVAVNVHLTGKTYREEIFADASKNTLRLADTVRRSTRNAMLHSRREDVHRMIAEIGQQEGIEHIRILNKQGVIIYSAAEEEIERIVDRKAEGCYQCHDSAEPLQRLDISQRTRVFESPSGHRTLGAIEVVYNEPACWTADCHAHPESHRLLGVLDIGVSLKDADLRASRAASHVLLVGVLSTLVICASVALFIDGAVIRRVRRLVECTGRVASGDLQVTIDGTRGDELGDLGRSFNTMTADLRAARMELNNWTQKLEQEVESKTHELELAQVHIVRSEKLSSVGQLAAGVAHELNNPLTGILTFAHLVSKRLPEDSPSRADLRVIIEQTQRCADIIRQLLDFSRESHAEMRPHDLHAVIDQAVALIEHQTLYHDIDIVREYERELPLVVMDAGQMQQVFVNLLINAGEAMPSGGRLTIVTSRLDGPARGEVERIQAVVRDTGIGIPKESLASVFDPFFTSKEVGQGIGLGLAVSYGIVEQHDGTIEVESEPGRGTAFTITLPCETRTE